MLLFYRATYSSAHATMATLLLSVLTTRTLWARQIVSALRIPVSRSIAPSCYKSGLRWFAHFLLFKKNTNPLPVTQQLTDGIRLLQNQVHLSNGQIRLCHTDCVSQILACPCSGPLTSDLSCSSSLTAVSFPTTWQRSGRGWTRIPTRLSLFCL